MLIIAFVIIFDKQQEADKIIVTINNTNIRLSTIDSIAAHDIYEIRLSVLNSLIKKELLHLEANKYNVSPDEIYNRLFITPVEITDKELKEFINNNPQFLIEPHIAYDYLKNIKAEEIINHFFDSLIKINLIEKHLRPDVFPVIDSKELFAFDINHVDEETIVYYLADLNCVYCNDKYPEFKKIMDRYNKIVSFKFIYLTEYYDLDAFSLAAANRQGKFLKMFDLITIDNIQYFDYNEYFYEIANKINLNLDDFEKDMNNKADIEKLITTRDYLYNKGVFTVPGFIVNNYLLDNPNAINYLEYVIIDELNSR